MLYLSKLTAKCIQCQYRWHSIKYTCTTKAITVYKVYTWQHCRWHSSATAVWNLPAMKFNRFSVVVTEASYSAAWSWYTVTHNWVLTSVHWRQDSAECPLTDIITISVHCLDALVLRGRRCLFLDGDGQALISNLSSSMTLHLHLCS